MDLSLVSTRASNTLFLELIILRVVDQGESCAQHGAYNMLVFLVIGVPLNLAVFGVAWIYRNTPYFWYIIGILVGSLLICMVARLIHQKAHWGDGLLGRR
jgi:hypothetical protein